jgi:hypothetical protein
MHAQWSRRADATLRRYALDVRSVVDRIASATDCGHRAVSSQTTSPSSSGCIALLGLFLAATSVPRTALASEASPCPALAIEVSDAARLTGAIRDVPLDCVLEEIAAIAGMEIVGAVDDAPVSSNLVRTPAVTALSRLLGARSYLLQLEGERPVRISFLGPTTHSRPEPTTRARGAEVVSAALRHTALDDPDVTKRHEALDRVASLPRLPVEIVASVAEQDIDPTMRRRALDLLASRGDGDPAGRVAAEILVRNDPDPDVRAAAAEVLRRAARASAPAIAQSPP